MSDVTRLLDAIQHGDPKAAEELLPLVYQELRQLAAAKMARENPGHTLHPTALVHEAWLKLAGPHGQAQFQNRAHFFGAAAEAMRRILVDSARRNRQLKRGGEQREQVELCDVHIVAPADDEKLLLVNKALDTLAREDALQAEIVKLRYFVGLNHHEIAQALEVNEKTVRRHWELAKVRLYDLISEPSARPESESPRQ
jgi:RNA polymerase sigma factor (TIGR02999 family)